MSCIIGLDVGTKTIGIAVGEAGAGLASPHSVLSRRGVKQDTAQLAEIISALGATEIVLGLPYELDGSLARGARLARQIGSAVHEATGLTVHEQDERYSTIEAERKLFEAGYDGRQRKGIIDAAAAAVILQDWLDRPD
jgi:putative Holliday junction resolvase